MRNNVIKNVSLSGNPIGVFQKNIDGPGEQVKKDVMEQAIVRRALKTVLAIESCVGCLDQLLSEDEGFSMRAGDPGIIAGGALPKSSKDAPSRGPSKDDQLIDDIVRHASEIGYVLGRSISKDELDHICRNWRSFYNSPLKFADSDMLFMIEEDLKSERLMDKLCR